MRYQVASVPRSRSGVVRVLAAWCALTAAFAVPHTAHAVTLTNQDSKSYKIEVKAKSARQEHELAPGKSLTGFCKDGCIIRLNGSEDADYALEGTERVSIEGGLVYYDGEEVKPKDTQE